jgi:hypothetical protein
MILQRISTDSNLIGDTYDFRQVWIIVCLGKGAYGKNYAVVVNEDGEEMKTFITTSLTPLIVGKVSSVEFSTEMTMEQLKDLKKHNPNEVKTKPKEKPTKKTPARKATPKKTSRITTRSQASKGPKKVTEYIESSSNTSESEEITRSYENLETEPPQAKKPKTESFEMALKPLESRFAAEVQV